MSRESGTAIPRRISALQMADILQAIHRGDRSDIAFAHVQNIGRAYPFGWGVGERFAGAVEGFHHKLRAEKALAAKRGNLNQGQRIAAQVARAARHNGQFAYMAGNRISTLEFVIGNFFLIH